VIYTVHFWYKKLNSRKHPSKFEGTVFAANKEKAEELVNEMFAGLPIEVEEPMSIVGPDFTLDKIYELHPVLKGISPEKGYIYDRTAHVQRFRKYAGL